MIVEPHSGLTTAPDAPLDGRAVWTAPVLECFDAESAEVGGGPGGDMYFAS